MTPTLTLILAALVAEETGRSAQRRNVSIFFFWLAFFASAIYILGAILSVITTVFTSISTLDMMDLSFAWLMPGQAVVSSLLGVFFVREEQEREENAREIKG